jgi:HEAT repeat protein
MVYDASMARKSGIRAALAAMVVLTALSPLAAQQKIQVVNSPLTQGLTKIFPEIASGYIDLNGNGKLDQTADLNETIPESRIKDGQLQAQEILDFIVAQWRFIPLDKLKAVQAAVKSTPGAINELIAIDFSSSLDDAVRQREIMGDELYLTPSAYKEAMAKLDDIITAMATAYKKEGQQNEGDFVTNRDALFSMIERGYPLPQDIPSDAKATLTTAMIGTVLKEKVSNPGRTKTAIRTLGQLKSPEAASYLVELADGSDYAADALKALGDIGYKPALPVMTKQLRTSTDIAVRKVALQSIGKIGGSEGLDTILDLAKPANRDSLPPELLGAVVQALSGLAQKGNADPRIQSSLKDFAGSDDPAVRKAAVQGLGSFVTAASAEALLAILNNDKDPGVRAAAVGALNRQKNEAVMPAFMKVLKEKDLDPALEITLLTALGDNPTGITAVNPIVDDLADKNPDVRSAASAALRKLYPGNQAVVTASLTRSLLATQDESLLVAGTALLASLADPTSLPALLTLIQKPLPEVQRNVTWALYRIRSSTNPKAVEELQKLVTNENEPVAVRINAVRAVGAIGFDSPQLNIWQTLVTTAQMRGEKYAMLRYFAVRSLGQLPSPNPQVIAALARSAVRDPDLELRKEAVSALQNLAATNADAVDALAGAYAQSDDQELKVRILEAIADMGSGRATDLAPDMLGSSVPISLKRRVLYAVSKTPTEASALVMLDAAKDTKIQDFVEAMLEGFPSSIMTPLVARRLRSESNKDIVSVLDSLSTQFSEQ